MRVLVAVPGVMLAVCGLITYVGSLMIGLIVCVCGLMMSMQVVDCGRFWAQDVDNTQMLNEVQMHLQQYINHVQHSVCLTLSFIKKLTKCNTVSITQKPV